MNIPVALANANLARSQLEASQWWPRSSGTGNHLDQCHRSLVACVAALQPDPPPSSVPPLAPGAVELFDWSTAAGWWGGANFEGPTGTIADTAAGIVFTVPQHPNGLSRAELDQGGNATTGGRAIKYGDRVRFVGTLTIDPSAVQGVLPAAGGVNFAQLGHPFTDATAGNLLRVYDDGNGLDLEFLVQGGSYQGVGKMYPVSAVGKVPRTAWATNVPLQVVVDMTARADSQAYFAAYVNGVKVDFGKGTDVLWCASLTNGGCPQRMRVGIYDPQHVAVARKITWKGCALWTRP